MLVQELIIKNSSFKKFDLLVKNNRLSHAYLIMSEDELYNKEFCNVMSLKLVCDTNKPCFNCENCKKLLDKVHPDVLTYPKNVEKGLLVDDSKSIIEESTIKPMVSNYKIFIINSIDKSTPQAQNKLLKTIEESPKNVIYLFNAVNKNLVLQTIISRTQLIELEPLTSESLKEYIDSITKNVNEKEIKNVNDFAISMGGGWLGKVLDFISNKNTDEYNFLVELLLEMKSSKDVVKYADKFANKKNFVLRLGFFQSIFEEILLSHFTQEKTKTFFNYNNMENLKNEYSPQAISYIIELITTAKMQYDANVSTSLIADNLLLKLLEVKFICKQQQ